MIFQSIKKAKSNSSSNINELKVGNQIYSGAAVADGFFSSLSSLKSINSESLANDPFFTQQSIDYEFIQEICDNGLKIPLITFDKASELLHKMKPNVNDFFSITPLHYINGGEHAISHF